MKYGLGHVRNLKPLVGMVWAITLLMLSGCGGGLPIVPEETEEPPGGTVGMEGDDDPPTGTDDPPTGTDDPPTVPAEPVPDPAPPAPPDHGGGQQGSRGVTWVWVTGSCEVHQFFEWEEVRPGIEQRRTVDVPVAVFTFHRMVGDSVDNPVGGYLELRFASREGIGHISSSYATGFAANKATVRHTWPFPNGGRREVGITDGGHTYYRHGSYFRDGNGRPYSATIEVKADMTFRTSPSGGWEPCT